jgi:uncharacterized membrane protein YhfC
LVLVVLASVYNSALADAVSPQENDIVRDGKIDAAGSDKVLSYDIQAKEGYQIGVAFLGKLKSGSLKVRVTNQEDRVLWHDQVSRAGNFRIYKTVKLPEPGMYKLILDHEGPAKAEFSFQWSAGKFDSPSVSPAATFAGWGMAIIAAAFIVFAALNKADWKYLCLGAGFWCGTVALKFAWAASTNTMAENIVAHLPKAIGDGLFDLYLGALTGVFEVGVTWLVLKYSRLGKVDWKRALSFGIGFGSVEALLLGLVFSSAATVAILAPDALPKTVSGMFLQSTDWASVLAPIWERFFSVFVHIFATVLIFYAIEQKRPGWFWAAFTYKSVVDSAAAYYMSLNSQSLSGLLVIEGIFAVFGIAGLIGTLWIKHNYDKGETAIAGLQEA